jgi:predicted amidohydrolase YtcJ
VLLFHNARVYSFDAPSRSFAYAHNVVVDQHRIVAVGEEPAGIGAHRVDLDGAVVVPALADCHVHLAGSGYLSGARDLSGVRSNRALHEAVERLPVDGRIVVGGRYDDALWPDGPADATALERFHADRIAMLTRVDSHSSVVNARTLRWLELPADVEGIERNEDGVPTGRLTRDANWRAQARFAERIPLEVRRAAERRAVDLALSRGVAHLHAQLVGFARDDYAAEVAAMRALPANVHSKICEPDPELARSFGLPYVGGDVFLDGSIGSGTAAMSAPYCGGGSGALRFDDDALYEYFESSERLGVAAGVHAIGDEAIGQAVRVWRRVLDDRPSANGCRHFIEHFELASDADIETCARLGIALSMQPQFDAAWGGRDELYERRLGVERTRSMNRLARIERAGALLCGGSDSPVCDLDPFAGMQAAVDHHQVSERLSRHAALAMYTVNAARFGYAERVTGDVRAGLSADFAVLDRDPFYAASFTDCRVLQTWIGGACVFDAGVL